MKYRRVVVLLNEEEYDQIKSIAGLVPMSAWFRALALYKSNSTGLEDKRPPCKHGLKFCKTCK